MTIVLGKIILDEKWRDGGQGECGEGAPFPDSHVAATPIALDPKAGSGGVARDGAAHCSNK